MPHPQDPAEQKAHKNVHKNIHKNAPKKVKSDVVSLPDVQTLKKQLNDIQYKIIHTHTAKRHLFSTQIQSLKRSLKMAHGTFSRDDFLQIQNKFVRLVEEIEKSILDVADKLSRFPKPTYDLILPVSQAKDEIYQAIKDNQVTVICGATGSGKTTQIAKICLELGLGSKGLIGHTQPRRIAARTVAIRIAEELGVNIGEFVGFKMRFSDQTNPNTAIKLMTDGILLAELTNDRYLSQYEVIIIDEAHERSLNIDFLLGILKQILPKRPDLKIIITSATIDPKRFALHFERVNCPVPIIEVSGRTYPVEIRYRPLVEDASHYTDGILDAVDELWKDAQYHANGDILVFLSGEREIRETAEALRKHHPPHVEILPLFSRLSQAEQNRIFKTTGTRRIVLATNVAETSLTVPGIKYVIDTGLARISRYNPRTRLQRLPIEAISRASANQRSGRCGRVSNGICIRLYSEDDFNARDEFLDPEIKRTHLAAVVLQMAHLRLGDPTLFPFIEAPDTRQIQDAYKSLYEIRAIDAHNHLTQLGKKLARLPIDPRLGAMVLNANTQNVLHEVLVLVCVLSIQDPRERPLEFQQKADEQHRLFHNPQSDFISLLNIWSWYQTQSHHLSNNQLNQLLKRHFLSVTRMREWKDLVKQLAGLMNEIDLKIRPFPTYSDQNQLQEFKQEDKGQDKGQDKGEDKKENKQEVEKKNSTYNFPIFKMDAIHQSLLAGLLDQIGRLGDDGFYLGANNRKFKLFPGSALRKKPPKWLMSMEIVETTQVYARTCAAIDPLWLEPIAQHLIKTHYSEPHWSKADGMVKAYANLSLLGLPIVSKRSIHYGPIDPVISREILIRDGLVAGDIKLRANFLKHNQTKILEVEALEDKIRRRDVLVEEWQLFEWYSHKLPTQMITAAALDKWCTFKTNTHKRHTNKANDANKIDVNIRTQVKEQTNNDLLKLELSDLIARDPNLEQSDYPSEILINYLSLSAIYQFEPAQIDDGMTLIVPLAALNLLNKTRLDWLVPGFILEKITAMIRSLPKSLRRHLVPAPEFAKQTLDALLLTPEVIGNDNLYTACAKILSRLGNVLIDMHDFNENDLDKHLRMNLRIVDQGGKTIAEGRDVYQLQDQFKVKAQNAFADLLHAPVSNTLNASRKNRKKNNGANTADVIDGVDGIGSASNVQVNAHKHDSAKQTESFDRVFSEVDWVLEKKLSFTRNDVVLTGFPALIIEDSSKLTPNDPKLSGIMLKKIIFDQEYLAHAQLKDTLLKLAHQKLHDKIKYLTKQWPSFGKLALMFRAVGTESALKDDLIQGVILDCILLDPLPLSATEFNLRIQNANNSMIEHANALSKIIIETLTLLSTLKQSLHSLHPANYALLEPAVLSHIKRLVYDGFVSQTPQKWRVHLPRYMKALATRIERFSQNIERDKLHDAIIQTHLKQYQEGLMRSQNRAVNVPELVEYRYLIEELSVSLFAQPMKTALPVSPKKLDTAWEKILKTIKDAGG